MKADIKEKWVTALRSGKYSQTKECLRDHTGHCCLGVLCDILKPDGWTNDSNHFTYGDEENDTEVPYSLSNSIGLRYSEQEELMEMNDKKGNSFDEIADYIEREL